MKKMLIILFLFGFSLFTYKEKIDSASIEKIDLKIKDDEVGMVFIPIHESNYLLLKTRQTSILFSIYGEDNPHDILKRFNEEIPIYSYTNKVKGKYNIEEKEPLSFENLKIYKKEENTIIDMENTTFCFFKKGDISLCDYVYFIEETDIHEDKIKLAFYDKRLDSSFEKKLYDHWIDTYKIKENEFTLVTFQKENYNVVKLPSYYFSVS